MNEWRPDEWLVIDELILTALHSSRPFPQLYRRGIQSFRRAPEVDTLVTNSNLLGTPRQQCLPESCRHLHRSSIVDHPQRTHNMRESSELHCARQVNALIKQLGGQIGCSVAGRQIAELGVGQPMGGEICHGQSILLPVLQEQMRGRRIVSQGNTVAAHV